MFYPQMLHKLIIINAPHPVTFERELRDNPEQRKASNYMLLFRSPKAESKLAENNYEWLLKMAFGQIIRDGVLSKEDIQGYVAAWSQPGALTGGLNYYRAANVLPLENPEEAKKNPPQATSLPEISVPVLVIWGEKDTALLTGCIEGLEKYIPDYTIRRVPDASHWIVREKPQLVNSIIGEFLAQPG
jgi:pimeloyl-ACP methyl ester carboxylesterase